MNQGIEEDNEDDLKEFLEKGAPGKTEPSPGKPPEKEENGNA